MTGLLAEANAKIKHETGKRPFGKRSGKLRWLRCWDWAVRCARWPAADRKEKSEQWQE